VLDLADEWERNRPRESIGGIALVLAAAIIVGSVLLLYWGAP